MSTITYSPVNIQTSAQSVPSIPSWFGEVTLIAHHFTRQGGLAAIEEQVHFARRRFGRYEVIDFLVVLFGYAISGEQTLEGFYERLQPWANAFMALFGRDRLPSRSTLSRFLAALNPAAVEDLRPLFLKDLLARPLVKEEHPGGLWGRYGNHFLVFDIDGTREAARERCLAENRRSTCASAALASALCPWIHRAQARGSRTHPHYGLAGPYPPVARHGLRNPGNGEYRTELRRAVAAIQSYLQTYGLLEEHAILRLDGLYGTATVLSDLAGLAYVARGKDYQLLKRAEVQARLHLPEDQQLTHPESGTVRALYDCPDLPLGASGKQCRLVVATHPAGAVKSRVGVTRANVVYELFLTNLPQSAFTAADVVALYLHRGSFENALSDEDQELDPDRWCSHAASGQEAWQIISQWVWNLRLELGHQLQPDPVRTTEFAPATPPAPPRTAPPSGYAPPQVGLPWKAGRFSGQDFPLQPDGTLRCPAGQSLVEHERRRETDGSLRVVYAASIRSCRPCPRPRALSMARQRHCEAAPGEHAAASIDRRACSSPVAGLESETSSTRVHASASAATRGSAGGAGSPCLPRSRACAPVPCTARALSSRLSRAARTQRASPNSEPGDDQIVRGPGRLCHLARFGDGLTPL
jgi:hypothetical protein